MLRVLKLPNVQNTSLQTYTYVWLLRTMLLPQTVRKASRPRRTVLMQCIHRYWLPDARVYFVDGIHVKSPFSRGDRFDCSFDPSKFPRIFSAYPLLEGNTTTGVGILA